MKPWHALRSLTVVPSKDPNHKEQIRWRSRFKDPFLRFSSQFFNIWKIVMVPQSRAYRLMGGCPAAVNLGCLCPAPQQYQDHFSTEQVSQQRSTTPPYIDWWFTTRLALSLEQPAGSEDECTLPLETLKSLESEHESFSIPLSLVRSLAAEPDDSPDTPPSPVLFSELDAAGEDLLKEAEQIGRSAELIEEFYKSKVFARAL